MGNARPDVHVLPSELLEAHSSDEGDYSCWCGAQVFEVCPECEGQPEDSPTCWRCGGGVEFDGGFVQRVLPCPDPLAYEGPHGLLIVHNAP